MYTYTQNRIVHHEDCRARSLYPWKRSETRLIFKNFGLYIVADDQEASREWLCEWTMKSCFSTQTKHCIINQSNRVSSHVLLVWQKNKNHPVFCPRMWSLICVFPANTLFNLWPSHPWYILSNKILQKKMAVADNFYHQNLSLVSVGLWAKLRLNQPQRIWKCSEV